MARDRSFSLTVNYDSYGTFNPPEPLQQEDVHALDYIHYYLVHKRTLVYHSLRRPVGVGDSPGSGVDPWLRACDTMPHSDARRGRFMRTTAGTVKGEDVRFTRAPFNAAPRACDVSEQQATLRLAQKEHRRTSGATRSALKSAHSMNKTCMLRTNRQ